MSRRHSRSRQHAQHKVAQGNPHIRLVKDEPAEIRESSRELARPLGPTECADDRPPVGDQKDYTPFGVSAANSAFATSALAREAEDRLPELPGAALRRQREARGLSLDDVVRTTKISKATVIAIEATDVAHLPAPIYTRGFVKSYAREVGLDPTFAADTYLAGVDGIGVEQAAADTHAQAVTSATPAESHHDSRPWALAPPRSTFGRVLGAAAAIGLVVYVVTASRGDDPASTVELAAPPASDVTPAGGVAEPVASSDATTAAITNAPLQLELLAHAPCWVAALVDGERALAKLLQPGERHTFTIDDEAVLRIGNPAALAYSINGQRGRSLGDGSHPVNVHITKDNFSEFLGS